MSQLPPYAHLLKLRTEEQADGSLLFAMPFHDDVVGRPMYLHGGAIAGLLEFAAYGTLRRALDGGAVTLKPITVTVDFMLGGKDHETYACAVVERLDLGDHVGFLLAPVAVDYAVGQAEFEFHRARRIEPGHEA